MNVNKAREKRFSRLHRKDSGSVIKATQDDFARDKHNKRGRQPQIPVYHFGMNSRSCDILKTAGKKAGVKVAESCSDEIRETRRERMLSKVGSAYQSLPGDRPPEAIAGTLPDGSRVPIYALEMVYNDAMLIDAICGEGKYESLAGETEKEILELARTLYGESLISKVN